MRGTRKITRTLVHVVMGFAVDHQLWAEPRLVLTMPTSVPEPMMNIPKRDIDFPPVAFAIPMFSFGIQLGRVERKNWDYDRMVSGPHPVAEDEPVIRQVLAWEDAAYAAALIKLHTRRLAKEWFEQNPNPILYLSKTVVYSHRKFDPIVCDWANFTLDKVNQCWYTY